MLHIKMDNLRPWVVATVTGGVVCFIGFRYLRRKQKPKAPPDTVVLHQFPRGPFAPSISPYPLKLETYLRMTSIPHQSDFSMQFSSKGKLPWMEYNGEEIADSQFCIEYLNKTLGIDLNSHLSSEERAIARAFRKLTEDSLFWALMYQRWVHDTRFLLQFAGWFIVTLRKGALKRQAWEQGIGRHSWKEILHIATGDIKSLSDFIGDKKFLLGDRPCQEDCSIFGFLAQWHWNDPDTEIGERLKEFPNLGAYCERMKATFWPDWDEYITEWGKRVPTK